MMACSQAVEPHAQSPGSVAISIQCQLAQSPALQPRLVLFVEHDGYSSGGTAHLIQLPEQFGRESQLCFGAGDGLQRHLRVSRSLRCRQAPALTHDIRAMVRATDAGLIGARDRALILLGFAGAFRRSELVGLDIEDCAFGKDGLTVMLRRSKTDQDGAGRKIGIPYGSNPETCPVRVLQSWLEQAALTCGPVFRSISRHGYVQAGRLSPADVARVVKKLAERSGLDPARYAGHSLRAGHATSAAIAGASERSIMNQTGHRSVQMVRRYIRDGSLFRENSAGKLGL